MNDKLKDGMTSADCDRSEQLVTFLYGESSAEESAAFRTHLSVCATCRDELSAFGDVRELVGVWQADLMNAAPALDVKELFAPTSATRYATPYPFRQRSAIVAFREFFRLSPVWLQASAVAAAIVVCALVALVVTRAEVRWDANGLALQTGGAERVVVRTIEVPGKDAFTREQVAETVTRELESARKQWDLERQGDDRVVRRVSQVDQKRTIPGRKRRGSRGVNDGKEFLASGNYRDDDEAPRLSDILGDVH